MRVGSLVYATNQGLGILAKSFYDAGIITDVIVIRHKHHRTYPEWYPNRFNMVDIGRVQKTDELARFCSGQRFDRPLDAMLFFETPFNWHLIPLCRKYGVKTFLMPMYECTPKVLPFQPDRFICPSLLDLRYFPIERSTFIPVPVNVKWRQRYKAEVFVHNAGHGGLKSRNGTGELLDAWKHVKSPAKLILRSQKPLQWSVDDPRIEVRVGTVPYEKLYEEGDVFIFPEKFNGLSLPLQEAKAAGMLVMATDRFPNNTYLPIEPLIPVTGYVRSSIGPAYKEFDEAIVSPKLIAAKVDQWYGKDIADYSILGKAWAETMSWEVLKPKYREALCQPI